jgi:threonyl-tRNA synthetase
MSNINITFPDKSVKEFPVNTTPLDIAEGISHNLALRSVCAEVNGKLVDMDFQIPESADIKLFTFDSPEGKEVYWHSTAHLMAQAVQSLYPDVKVTIGPAVENGFYYDFDREKSFSDEEMLKIEEKMAELAKAHLEFTREEMSREDALKMFEEMGETYKVEILNEIPEGETISIYRQGEFVDLCRGPHILNTAKIKAVKLLKTSGAYWRGDERNKMLKRIYGISFPTKKELKKYLKNLEEAKKRDHRKIGKELDLFSISDNIGAGLVLWHPNGALMRSVIEGYWKDEHFKAGYNLVNTPHIGKAELWKTSGHLGFYNDSMYSSIEVEGQDYYLKPMNCPFHIEIYNSQKRSYRELPVRYAEMGTVYRYERSGTLHGLMRVRGFTQDDAHIICTPDQLNEEVEKLIDFSFAMLRAFGFEDFKVYLSTKPQKSVGEDSDWETATESLKVALEKHEIEYDIDEGGGAFYGPKIDIKIKDALDRSWQCSTVQFDFNLPTRFNMEYTGADNQSHRPFMLHRALLGSMERFFGTLIEYHGGNFPTWLCPTQVMVIPVSDNFRHYAERECERLKKHGIRAKIDLRNEKMGYKIREAETQKIPYMFIVGQREEDTNTVSIRKHTIGDAGSLSTEEAIEMVLDDIDKKKNHKK